MSKFRCECGHVISDQSWGLPYKGELIPDGFMETFYDRLGQLIDDLLQATAQGRRAEWVRQKLGQSYASELPDSALIWDAFDFRDTTRIMYQCEQCGRLWVQIGSANHFASFVPEGPEGRNILAADPDAE